MKFHLATGIGNRFTALAEGLVDVNGERIHENVLVTATRVVRAWTRGGIIDLSAEEIAGLLDDAPEVVLLGTGRSLRFPAPATLRPLVEAQVGYEVMSTPAACRTFNILSAEGRRVTAALIVD